MAYMIPKIPLNYDPWSKEDLMFKSLESLSDEFYVFHSFRIYRERKRGLEEHEMDFVIYNRKLGILVLECKAGRVHYDYQNNQWLYGNGGEMKHGGPFNQANQNMYNIKNYIEDTRSLQFLSRKCRFRSGVWFVDLTKGQLDTMYLPANVDKKMILTRESLDDPLPYIETIFNMNRFGIESETNLTDADHKLLLERALCPQVDIVPTVSFQDDLNRFTFNRLIREQVQVLNFLTEQKFAAINGAAGTGKTMIALEKAKRDACNGDKVLFLCFNEQLCNFLKEKNENDNINFYTIHGYACSKIKSSEANFKKLSDYLYTFIDNTTFPYKQIIVDEGQDFGQEAIEKNEILRLFYEIVSQIDGGSLFIFYDKLQNIQSNDLPSIIAEADCKITLYKNCRNTKNIADTSLRPITQRKISMKDDALIGEQANLHYCENRGSEKEVLDELITKYLENNYSEKNIVILTCKTEEKSFLNDYTRNGKYRKCKFTTCRKFKGLEADIIILVDIDDKTFQSELNNEIENRMMFYVGSSRARFYLEMITSMDVLQCKLVLTDCLNQKKVRNSKKELATKLNATAIVHK